MALPSVVEAANILQRTFLPNQVYEIININRTPFVAIVVFKKGGETWHLFKTRDNIVQVYVAYSLKTRDLDYWFPLRLQRPNIKSIEKNTLLYRRAKENNPLKDNPTFFADDPGFNFDYVRPPFVPGYVDLIFKVKKTVRVLYFDQWRHSILNLVQGIDIEKILYHTCLSYGCDGWKVASYSDQPKSVQEKFDRDVWDMTTKDFVKHEIAIINPSDYVTIVQETKFGSPPESSGESKVVDYPTEHDIDIHQEDHDTHRPKDEDPAEHTIYQEDHDSHSSEDEEDPAADAFPPDEEDPAADAFPKLRL